MKVKLHRNKAFEMPKLDRLQALADVESLYHLLPRGNLSKPKGKLGVLPDFGSINDYSAYCDSSLVAKDRLTTDFLKKFKGYTSEDPLGAAIETFLAAEIKCKETNRRLRTLRNGARAPYLNSIMLMAQRKISRVLGSFSLSELLDESKWGPGVTSSVKGSYTDASNKFAGKPQTTPPFAKSASQLISMIPSWSALLADQDPGMWVSPLLETIRGNSVAFVPKTAKTHRSIAVEPHVNVFFQLGLGRMIRKRLKRAANINLDDQSLNQRLAQLGSIDGTLATIDLSNASDTIAKELVRDLLPEDWFAWLDRIRSREGKLPKGEFFSYEKFSSQGNGFTFDLESLIFWALSSSVVERSGYNPFWVNVMGDDIIVPSGCYLKVARVLNLCGFEVNRGKSFFRGPFRESCGHDYFRGVNVRPVYVKDIPDTPLHWLRIANALRRLASAWLRDHGTNLSLKAAYDFAVSRVPIAFRFKIPDGFGDGGLIVNFDEARPPVARDRVNTQGWEGFIFHHLTSVSDKINTTNRSLVTASLHRMTQRGNLVSLRGRVSYKKATSIATSWSDLGNWV